MKKLENECVGCPPEIGCLGKHCPCRDVPHWYCDECGEEATLYEYDGRELCRDCVIQEMKVVEGSERW